MSKPFDFSELAIELKSKGLDLAEDGARHAFDGVLNWIEKSVIASENKYDDLFLLVLPTMKKEIYKLIDKIDGEVDGPK